MKPILGVSWLLLLAGCPVEPPVPNDSPWETSEVTFEDAQIIVEKVSYRVDGLRIFGEVCRPKGEGPFPLFISNHGGFEGIGDGFTGGACADLARNGFVGVLSSYRGEDGSDGFIEVCNGEVDDVLEITRIAQTLPFVNPARSLMFGGSHGGCNTLRAVQRGVPVAAAVALVPPTDLARLHADWTAEVAQDPTTLEGQVSLQLINIVEAGTGGAPNEVPQEYSQRSALSFVEELDAWPGALFIAAGSEDFLVLPSQECSLVAAAAGFESFRVVDPTGAVSTETPVGCANEGVNWLAGPKPTNVWPNRRYFVFYDGADHGLQGPNASVAASDFIGFLLTHLPP